MRHLGDITKIDGTEIRPVDCVIGGSPCQDLSVAGKRAGLSGERSGLFMDQIRIVKEMRLFTGKPRFMVWENVPGALSSKKGEDFCVVLEEIVKIVDQDAVIPRPPGKWTPAGAIMGDGWSVAWRILDAQFWGVPQRRRRIALVADFGGESAPQILFERKSLQRGSAESGETQEGASAGAEGCTGNTGMYIFKAGNGVKAGLALSKTVAPTLTSAGSGMNQAPTICIQGNCIDRADTAGCNGKGWKYDQCYTLNTIDRHAGWTYPDITGTVCASGASMNRPSGQANETDLSVVRCKSYGEYTTDTKSSTIKSSIDITNGDIVIGLDGDKNAYFDQYGTLRSHDSGGCEELVMRCGLVRRLTPLECERLQGFPDGWTDIGDWTDSRGRMRKTSDSARYKALGNSIALPPWRYVITRLCGQIGGRATMGSLFDGIGGFPLIWEEINGTGSCLWASEIEEFPIAVTKMRIGGWE